MAFDLCKSEEVEKTIGDVKIIIIAMNTVQRSKLSDLSRTTGMEGVAKTAEYILRSLTKTIKIEDKDFEPFELSNSMNPHNVEHAKAMGAIVRAGLDAAFPEPEDVKTSGAQPQPTSMESAAKSAPSES